MKFVVKVEVNRKNCLPSIALVLTVLIVTLPVASRADSREEWMYGYGLALFDKGAGRAEEILGNFINAYPKNANLPVAEYLVAILKQRGGDTVQFAAARDVALAHTAAISDTLARESVLGEILVRAADHGDSGLMNQVLDDSFLRTSRHATGIRFQRTWLAFLDGETETIAGELSSFDESSDALDRTALAYMRASLAFGNEDFRGVLGILRRRPPADHVLAKDYGLLKFWAAIRGDQFEEALTAWKPLELEYKIAPDSALEKAHLLALLETRRYSEAVSDGLRCHIDNAWPFCMDAVSEASNVAMGIAPADDVLESAVRLLIDEPFEPRLTAIVGNFVEAIERTGDVEALRIALISLESAPQDAFATIASRAFRSSISGQRDSSSLLIYEIAVDQLTAEDRVPASLIFLRHGKNAAALNEGLRIARESDKAATAERGIAIAVEALSYDKELRSHMNLGELSRLAAERELRLDSGASYYLMTWSLDARDTSAMTALRAAPRIDRAYRDSAIVDSIERDLKDRRWEKIHWMRSTLAGGPVSFSIRRALAAASFIAFYGTNSPAEALDIFESESMTLRGMPDEQDIVVMVVTAAETILAPARTMKYYRLLLAMSPSDSVAVPVRVALAEALASSGDESGEAEELLKSIGSDSAVSDDIRARIFFLTGTIASAKGDVETALENWSKIAKMWPNSPIGLNAEKMVKLITVEGDD